MCIVHKIGDGYFGIETENRPLDLEVVAFIDEVYREVVSRRQVPSLPRRLGVATEIIREEPIKPKPVRSRTRAASQVPVD